MPPLDLPQPTPDEAAEGPQALGEASAIAAGVDLSDRKQINEFNQLLRIDRADSHLHRILVCGMYLAAGAAAVLFVVIVLNKTLPINRRWLGVDEMKEIYEFLFTGGFGAAMGFAGKRFLK